MTAAYNTSQIAMSFPKHLATITNFSLPPSVSRCSLSQTGGGACSAVQVPWPERHPALQVRLGPGGGAVLPEVVQTGDGVLPVHPSDSEGSVQQLQEH